MLYYAIFGHQERKKEVYFTFESPNTLWHVKYGKMSKKIQEKTLPHQQNMLTNQRQVNKHNSVQLGNSDI